MNIKNTENALEFELDFRYEGMKQKALSAVSGSVEKGRCVCLCGSSGCGKSTLLRCVNRLIPQFYEGELKGFCRMAGRELSGLSIGETGRLAASVFQDPRSQFFTMNSSTELAFGLENFGFSQEEMKKRVDGAFSRFGLEELRDRNVFALSSGQRQLVAILSAWALDTDIFLLDEPTANLDPAAIEKLSALLLRMKEQGRTLFISEHRLYYLKDIADEYWLMDKGEIIKKISSREFALLSDSGLRELGLRTSSLSLIGHEPKKPEMPPQSCCLRAEDISFSYKKGGQRIINKLSFSARSGEALCLVGKNGCGKTSFGKLCAGLYTPSSGSFSLDGRRLSPKELSRNSIFVMQEAEFQFFTNSVMNELLYGAPRSEERRKRAEELLKRTGLWQCRNRHPFSLSGGQMQKLVLLLACLSPKPIAVLDEPTAGLDRKSLECCAQLINEMRKTKLVILISHDLELISLVCTGAAAIEEGRISRSFDLSSDEEFERLREYMSHSLKDNPLPEREKARSGPSADPRIKLIIMLLAMLSGIGTHEGLILGSFAAVMLVFIYEKNLKLFLSGALLMGSVYLVYFLFPGVVSAFMVSFFPRMILICLAAMMLVQEREVPRTLAGLRALHVPEKIIMICSVIFRFFPVLNKDVSIMNESIKSRGFFPRFSDKLRALPEYAEIMIVPMVFRVIRIAEALSASAETRGIALSGRRESYISLKIRPADIVIISSALLFIAAGLIL